MNNNPTPSCSMCIEPLRCWQTYQDVITFNHMPQGPIRRLVKSVRPPKLSPFQPRPSNEDCKLVLMRTSDASAKTLQSYMTSGDLPSVMDYLHEHGYIVDFAEIYLGCDGCSGNKRCIATINYP